MSTRTAKNRKNLYLWIIACIIAVGIITGYSDGRVDKAAMSETVLQP